jgi:hypothetical protein
MMSLRYVRYCICHSYGTTGGIKQMGMHNRSKNGHGAWVAFWFHPIHIDTDTDADMSKRIRLKICIKTDSGLGEKMRRRGRQKLE